MAAEQVLVMAMTRMLSGVCTACFTAHSDPASHLRWVRPVKEHDALLLGDLTDADGRVLQCDDVVELHLQTPCPDPPHVEDWITDFIYHRPRLLRRLEGDRRVRFLAEHLDQAPRDVLGQQPTRSLCLVRPDDLWARFEIDRYSLKYQARIGFRLTGAEHSGAESEQGVPVTDLKWRALGRTWLGSDEGELSLGADDLRKKLGADDIYLALGLSRGYRGRPWLLVIGVHAVPDYVAEVDYANL